LKVPISEKKAVKCAICQIGVTQPSTASLFLERGEATVIIKHVPALVCDNCGESYFDSETTQYALNLAEEVLKLGLEVAIQHYVSPSKIEEKFVA
jgi:YgiT-type zinc finger domain-containing protein